jgi:ubiquitin-like modifier-activating enzyme ATG7
MNKRKNEKKHMIMPGNIINSNTEEEFKNFDKGEILKKVGEKIFKNISSKEWLKNPSLLLEFILLSFADLKTHKFRYFFF